LASTHRQTVTGLATTLALGLVLAAVLLLLPGAASAETGFKTIRPQQTISILNPQDVVYDYYGDHAYVITKDPSPRIVLYHINGDGFWEFEDFIALGAGADPSFIDWTWDGYLVVGDDNSERYLFYDDETGEFVGSEPYGASVQFLTGLAQGFYGEISADFGDGFSAGSLWYGPGFGMELVMPDTRTPNGIELLPDPPKTLDVMSADASAAKRLRSVLLVIDANNSKILRVRDAATPSLGGTLPGPPGASGIKPPRDIAVGALNFRSDDDKPAVYPVFVPVPALGQVFWSSGPSGPWHRVFDNPTGAPIRSDATCNQLAVTDFAADAVRILRLRAPRGSECEQLADVVAGGGSLARGFRLRVEPRVDAQARMRVRLGGIRSRAKSFAVTTGTIKTVRVRFSPGAVRRLLAKLARRGHLRGIVKTRFQNQNGETAVIKRGLRLSAG
jgi:hypothetical protein